MIKIDEVRFLNYRQYRNFSISFKDNKSNLFVIRAKNGTGKTTFLSGILWCLYGNEYLQNEKKALKIVNEKVATEASNDQKIVVEIAIKVATPENYLEITRKQQFVVKTDLFNNNKTVKESGKSNLYVTVSSLIDKTNSQPYEGVEAENIIKQYFDESIYNYFFFDGEKLQSYFDKQNANMIQNSIFNISQINLLKDAIKHIKELFKETEKRIQKEFNMDENLYAKRDKAIEDIEKIEKENEELEKEKNGYDEQIKDYENKLRGYNPVKQKQLERERLERSLYNLNIRKKQFIDDRNKFIREYTILLNFAPRIKKTMKLIELKREEGALPPSIDKEKLQDMLNNNVERCPMCNSPVTDSVLKYIHEILQRLDYSQETGNTLNQLYVALETMMFKIERYEEEKAKIIAIEKNIRDEEQNIEDALNQIRKFMLSYDVDIDDINPSEIEALLSKAKKGRDWVVGRISSNKVRIEQLIKDKEDLEKQIKEEEDSKVLKGKLVRKSEIYKNIGDSFAFVRDEIMKRVKHEIEMSTWETFNAMAWKTNTFSGIVINDNYEVSVLNKNGKEMTGSLSGAESMALAYAFTLAIHKASGRNCPLVVDSPLGRVSDENRINMANELLKVSKDKQIIMLFTPDEYSNDVSDVYDNIVEIKNISLTDDESEVILVGDLYE